MHYISFALNICFFCYIFNNRFGYCEDNSSCGLSSLKCVFNESYFNLSTRNSFNIQCIQHENLFVEVDSVNHEARVMMLKLKLPDSCNIVNSMLPKLEDNENSGSISFVTVLIIFIIIVVFYFAFGAFLNSMNGAVRWEILPHYQFFRKLGCLIRDGVLYCAHGCQSSTSYDRI